MSRRPIHASRPRHADAPRRGLTAALAVAMVAALLATSGPVGAAPRAYVRTRPSGARLWSALETIPAARDAATRSFLRPSRYLPYTLNTPSTVRA